MSELEAFVSEDLAWRYVKMTCNTEDKSLEEAYLFFELEHADYPIQIQATLGNEVIQIPFSPYRSCLWHGFYPPGTEEIGK